MSQYDADAAGGEPSPASSSMTPTENVGLASNANEALARCGVPGCGHPIIDHRLIDNGPSRWPIGWCNECEGTEAYTHYPETQAAEAADREAAAGSVADAHPARVRPAPPSAAVAHDPTVCTGTDAVPCGCVCFDCNERGIHQAAEAADREWPAFGMVPDIPPAAAPLDVEALAALRWALDALGPRPPGAGLLYEREYEKAEAAYADAIRKRGGA